MLPGFSGLLIRSRPGNGRLSARTLRSAIRTGKAKTYVETGRNGLGVERVTPWSRVRFGQPEHTAGALLPAVEPRAGGRYCRRCSPSILPTSAVAFGYLGSSCVRPVDE